MAEDISYGSDPQGFARALEQIKSLEAAKAELDTKEQQLRASEQASTTAVIDSTAAMQRAIDATRQLAQETGTLSSQLAQETELLRTNTDLWVTRVAAMREAGTAGARAVTAPTASRAAAAAEVAAASAPAVESTRTPAVAAISREEIDRRVAAAVQARSYLPSPAQSMSGDVQRQLADREMMRQQAVNLGAQTIQNRTAVPSPQRSERLMLPAAQDMSAMQQQAQAAALVAENNDRAAANATRLSAAYDEARQKSMQMAQAQTDISVAANREEAAYAGVNSALSRNGALTTEFIQAFARGDVTLQEFTSQMTNTIGKFGGWAIAGAAVYGVADALKSVAEGASATQEGVQNLSRFIPSVSSGPDRQQAEGMFRDLSQQMNVPISEVTSAMQVMARVFHDVADAGEATKAVLLASRLDQIPQAQSEQYLVGISQALGITKGSGVVGVVNSLNALQNEYGARVSQTLPGVAAAAPAALAGGLSGSMLEALVGAGVRGGIQGRQVGTALLRSIGGEAYRPTSEATFRRYGISNQALQPGHYGELMEQLIQRVTNPAPGKELTGADLNQLALALGGTLLGPRTFEPLLEHANLIGPMQRAAAHPPSATQELDKVLGGVDERAKRLGIELENLGSELESSGLLTPVELLLQGLDLVGRALETVISPFQEFGSIVSQLPGPLKDVLGVVAAGGALRAASRTDWGFAAQSAISRLPGLGALADDPRRQVTGTVARLRTFTLADLQSEEEGARRASATSGRVARRFRGAAGAAQAVATEHARLAAANPNDPELAAQAAASQEAANKAAEQAEVAEQRFAQAAMRAAEAADERATLEDQIKRYSDSSLSYAERAAQIAADQLAVDDEILQAKQNLLRGTEASASAAARAAGITGTTAGAAVAGLGAGVLGQQRATQALQDATPEVAAAALGATALAENPEALQQLAQSGSLPEAEQVGTSEAATAEAASAQMGLLGRIRASPAAQDVSRLASGATGLGANLLLAGAASGGGSLLGAAALPMMIGGGMAGGTAGNLIGAIGMGAFGASQFGGAIGSRLGGVADYLGFSRGEGAGAAAGEAMLSNPLLGGALALAGTGATTPGAGGAATAIAGGAIAGGVTIGRTIGGALGSLSDEFTGPLGTLGGMAIGGAIGGAAGDVLHMVLGSSDKTGPTGPSGAAKSAEARVQSILYGSQPSVAAQAPFSSTFAAAINAAYDNGNTQQAQQNQAAVQTTIRSLTQSLKDTAYGSPLSNTTQSALAQAIGGAVTSKGFAKDPGDVGQNIDTAQQGLMQRNQSALAYELAQNPSNVAALSSNSAALTQLQRFGGTEAASARLQGMGQDVTADQRTLSGDTAALQRATTSGATGSVVTQLQKSIASARSALTQAKARESQANQMLSGLKEQDITQAQSDAAAVLQQIATNIGDAASLAEASTGDKLTQAADAVRAAQETISNTRQVKGLSPEQRRTAQQQNQAALYQALQQQASTSAQELQGTEQVTASRIPDWEPVQQAQVALTNARQYYQRVKNALLPNGKPAFDAEQVNQALAAQNQAAIALADANYQWQTQIASDTAALQEAQNPAYAYGQAQAQIGLGQTQLGLARNRPERLEAQAQILQGQTAAKEALQQTAQTTFQVTEAQQTGDPVAQAETQVAAAYRALAMSLGPDQALQARLQLAQAVQTLHQANQQYIQEMGAYEASTTNNQLQQDADQLAAANKALQQAEQGHYGAGTILQDTTTRNQAALQQTNDYVSQRLATIQYQQQTLQISAQGALQELEGLAKLKNLSVQQKQQISEQMYEIETNQDNTSMFDLAPAGGGNIKVPTILDVVRNAQAGERRISRGQDVGGLNIGGRVQVGGASIATTDGAMNTHDVTTHTKLDQVIAAIKQSGTTATTTSSSTHVGDALDRVSRRVRTTAKNAGVR